MNWGPVERMWRRWLLAQEYRSSLGLRTNIYIREIGRDGQPPIEEVEDLVNPNRWVSGEPLDLWFPPEDLYSPAYTLDHILSRIAYVYQHRWRVPLYKPGDFDLDRNESAIRMNIRERDAFIFYIMHFSGLVESPYWDYIHEWSTNTLYEVPEVQERPYQMAEAFWEEYGKWADLMVTTRLNQGERLPQSWRSLWLCQRYCNYVDSQIPKLTTGPTDFLWNSVLEGQSSSHVWRIKPSELAPPTGDVNQITFPPGLHGSQALDVLLAQVWYYTVYLPWSKARLLSRKLPLLQLQIEAHAFVAMIMQRHGLTRPIYEDDLATWFESRAEYPGSDERVTEAAQTFWDQHAQRMLRRI